MTRSSVAAFVAGDVAGLIKVSASARRTVPADSINVAAAAIPSKRIGLALRPKLLSMDFSLKLDSGVATLVYRPASSLFICSCSQD